MTLLPDNSPFSKEQLAALNPALGGLNRDQSLWLSGFLSGAQSGVPAGATPQATSPLTVLYGTESGNAETLADRAVKAAKKQGFKATLKDMADMTPQQVAKLENVLVVISTWGEGDPPERAVDFYEALMKDDVPSYKGMRYAVCGLGDSSYEHFCQMGKIFDERFEALGAERMEARVDCDLDFEAPFEKWLSASLAALKDKLGMGAAVVASSPALSMPSQASWSKANPFHAELLDKVNLNGTGSVKETIHLELSLEGSGIRYMPGDALGVKPKNCPEVIDDLVATAGFKGDEEVNRPDGSAGPLRTVLIEELDSTVLSKKIIEAYAAFAHNSDLEALLSDSRALKTYTEGREIVDLFHEYKPKDVSPQQLATLLRIMPPRLYSIASSLSAHPDEVHLTVGTVRYQTHGRTRKGVASTYLADRVAVGDKVPVYIHANNNFRLPEDPSTPVIMIGPGTGIAPFRAFIEERAATGAAGESWLFFGDQHYSYDFLYQLEMQDYIKEGHLNRLDVAFSRDTPEKVYVQHKMQEQAAAFYDWVQKGAHVYVCGDAKKMAKDVDKMFIQIVSEQGKMSASDAKKYVKELQKSKRYQKDVY